VLPKDTTGETTIVTPAEEEEQFEVEGGVIEQEYDRKAREQREHFDGLHQIVSDESNARHAALVVQQQQARADLQAQYPDSHRRKPEVKGERKKRVKRKWTCNKM
jgi:hypothetical protein